MLEGKGVPYRYRDDVREPLSKDEIRGLHRRPDRGARASDGSLRHHRFP